LEFKLLKNWYDIYIS